MIRVQLPTDLQTLAQITGEVMIEVNGEATQRSVFDAIEARYPMLLGTMRDLVSQQRRPFLRFFACETDLSHESPDTPLPRSVISGSEPLKIIGAPAGGQVEASRVQALSKANVADLVIPEVVPPSPGGKHRGSVLVMSDERTSLKSLFSILIEDGYAVHEGQLDAVSQLPLVIKVMPDLLLIDIRNPAIDGYRGCATLKNDPITKAIPVIFIGRIDRIINQAKALVSGAVDYVTEPFDPQEVLWRIETHLSLRRLGENLKSAARNSSAEAGVADKHFERAFQEIQILTQATCRKHAEEKVRQAASELKKTKEALQSSERNLAGIINTIPAFAWSARPDGFADFLNDRWLDYSGLSAEQALGWKWTSAIHPEDLNRLTDYWRSIMVAGEPGEIEVRIRRFDGEYRWFLIRANAVRDESGSIVKWYGTNTDIDDRKRAEARVEQAYLRLAEAQRLSKTGSFITDLLADEHDWSEEAFRIFEFEPSTKVTVQMIRNIVHPGDLPTFDAVIARGMTGNDVDFVFRIVPTRGVVKHVRGMARVMTQGGGHPLFIGAVQDITDSKVAEEALDKARSQLAHVSRITTLNALTASIAHEINQPLSGIITNSGTCLRMLNSDSPNIEGARETVRRTLRDGNRAADVITRLRALFSKKEFTLEPVDLNEATREVITLSLGDLQRNRIVLHSELAENLPLVMGDRIQLQQVTLNLLRNASEAMVSIEDRPRQIIIRTQREGDDRVRLSVQDVGSGIDPQKLERLFEAFFTTKTGGMGIGLSVSHSIIERHHGRLWVEPNDGPGVTFSFSIPSSILGLPESISDA